MVALKRFTVSRENQTDWNYIIGIHGDDGSLIQLRASVEDLDQISVAVDAQMNAMVAYAEQVNTEK